MLKYYLSILVLLQTLKISAQEDTVFHSIRPNTHYLKSYYYDMKDIATVPFHMNCKRAVGYSIAAASIGSMFLVDEQIQKYSQENRTSNTDWVATHLLEPVGAGEYTCGMFALLYTQGAIFKNDRSKKAALNGLKSFLIASFLVQIPKYSLRRVRPNFSPDDSWNWFGDISDKSFMSGHTTAAFAAMSAIALEYKETVWIPIFCYSVAALAGYSRINDNKHWASDVVGGAFLGYGVASLIYNANNWGVPFYPVVSTDGVSLSFVIQL